MHKASDYRLNAEECRKLARSLGASGEQRDQLLRMAQTWEALAKEREQAGDRALGPG
jgi:hypothetical protein